MAMLVFASCSSSDEVSSEADGDMGSLQLTFTISMNHVTASRADTWGDNDYPTQTANEWENSIAWGKMQVLVYNENDKLLGEVENVRYSRLSSDDNNIYEVLGSLKVDTVNVKEGKLNCKMVVLANYDEKIANMNVGDDISAIKDAAYGYDPEKIANRSAFIPMWGVQTYNDNNSETQYKALTIERGKRINVGNIDMLRSMAKIKVALDDETYEGYRIEKVTLSNYNQKGYIIPAGYDATTTKSLYYESTTDSPVSFNPYESKAGKTIGFEEDEESGSERKSYIVYVPEFSTSSDESKNTGSLSDGTDPCIDLWIAPLTDETNTKQYRVQLRPYSDGKPTTNVVNLKRNTIYEYTVGGLGTGHQSIDYKVMPWTEGGTNEIDYKFESTLSRENVKTTTYTEEGTTTTAVALAYNSNYTEDYSPWLTLDVTTPFAWMVQTNNPSFGFVTKQEDGSISAVAKYLSVDGSKKLTFKLVPLQDLSLTDDNRSRRASVFITIQSSADGVASKVPFNSGTSPLPGDEEQVIYYQESRTTYDGL